MGGIIIIIIIIIIILGFGVLGELFFGSNLRNIVALSIRKEEFVGGDRKSLGMEKISPVEEWRDDIRSNKKTHKNIHYCWPRSW
jgi:hypothetical protein